MPFTEPAWIHALSRLREAARAGDPWAAEFLGNDPAEWADRAGWSPRGLMEDRSLVLRPFIWFSKSAAQGCREAMHGLARLYAHKESAHRNDAEAVFWTILATTYRGGACSTHPPSREALALWRELMGRVSPEDREIAKVRASLWRHRNKDRGTPGSEALAP